MCNNPEVSAAVNSAKCASVGALIAGIAACLGFVVGGSLAGVGGILGLIASSMLLCCGPQKKAEGKGMVRVATQTRDTWPGPASMLATASAFESPPHP